MGHVTFESFAQHPVELDADVVVVGSGAGGSAAAVVFARGGRSVAIVEAGQSIIGSNGAKERRAGQESGPQGPDPGLEKRPAPLHGGGFLLFEQLKDGPGDPFGRRRIVDEPAALFPRAFGPAPVGGIRNGLARDRVVEGGADVSGAEIDDPDAEWFQLHP